MINVVNKALIQIKLYHVDIATVCYIDGRAVIHWYVLTIVIDISKFSDLQLWTIFFPWYLRSLNEREEHALTL